jgi:RNA polymerase sigma-70 factor (ECF subfamily)
LHEAFRTEPDDSVEYQRHVRVEQIVADVAEDLLGYFARRCDPQSAAADLLAETLVVLWRRVDALPSDPAEVRMWAYGVARKVLSQHRRTSSRRSAVADRLRAQIQVDTRVDHSDSHTFDEVREAVAGLDARDREIIRLVHWEGFSLAEVARLTEISDGTVRSRYHRARGRLRRMLADAQD